jgi:hypothetical protein
MPSCNAISSVGENNGCGFFLLLINCWCWWPSWALGICYACSTIFKHFHPLVCASSPYWVHKCAWTSAPLTSSAHKYLMTFLCSSLVQTERHTDIVITQWLGWGPESRSDNQNMVYNAAKSQRPNTYQYPTGKKVWKLLEVPSYNVVSSTVYDIKKWKDQLWSFMASNESVKGFFRQQTLKEPKHSQTGCFVSALQQCFSQETPWLGLW